MNKKILLGILILVLSITHLNAQKEVADLLKTGVEDATVLGKAYIEPFGGMLGRSLNAGWYNTAKVHSILGFDLTLGLNMPMASSSVKKFDVNDCLPKMSGWSLANSENHLTPTMSGSMKENRPVLVKNGERIELPDGLDWNFMLSPMIQIGLGLPFHTEIIGRFFPTISHSDYGKVGVWGIGLKHEIKDYLPVIKHVPLFQSSILLGYTKMGMDVKIKNLGLSGISDQKLLFDAYGFTARLLVGVNIPIVSFYMGLGYGHSSCDFDMKGWYKIGNENDIEVIKEDPVSIDNKYNYFDANIGMRLKFGVITLHGDYTFGDYSVISAGLGIAFR